MDKIRQQANKEIILVIVAVIIGAFIGFAIKSTNAHTPCNDVYQEPECGYVQVVSPITGILESKYVCK